MTGNDLILKLFKTRLSIINVGIDKLVEHLFKYDVKVVQVDWRPPASGKPEVLKKLRELAK